VTSHSFEFYSGYAFALWAITALEGFTLTREIPWWTSD
jgi:hypothetical protein